MLFFDQDHLLFITREKTGFILHFVDSEKIRWQTPLDASFLNTREEVKHSDVVYIAGNDQHFYLHINDQKVACISLDSGEMVWEYLGGMPKI